jgi:hypothetical protein
MQSSGVGFEIAFDVWRHRQSRLSLQRRDQRIASLGTAEVKAPNPLSELLVS